MAVSPQRVGILAAFYLAGIACADGDWRDEIGAGLQVIPVEQRADMILPAETWRFRKGTSDPGAWFAPEFVEDASWSDAATPVGYGDGDDRTVLDDMRNGYTSVYLRKTFTLSDAPLPEKLLLRVFADDGAVVYLNAIEVARLHVGVGNLAHDATAQVHEVEWEPVIIPNADALLLPGENTLAIHGLNQSLGSSDFSIDASLHSVSTVITMAEAVQRVEVPPDSGNFERRFLPQAAPEDLVTLNADFAGGGQYANIRFEVRSDEELTLGIPSAHASRVARIAFGSTGSLRPNVGFVRCFSADHWIRSGYLLSGSDLPPLIESAPIQNHSWVANFSEDDEPEEMDDILTRLDFASVRDQFLPICGVDNGAGKRVPPALASAFNVLSVGVSSGNHSRGGTPEEIGAPGRQKPEIVAPLSATSFATAAVTSAAATLYGAAEGDTDARRPEVLKAILMAGATREEFPSWSRTPERPMDPVYGVGELNVGNSSAILVAGEQASRSTALVANTGWHAGTGSAAARTYRFELETPSRFSAVLTWNRIVTSRGAVFQPSAAVANLDLEFLLEDDLIDTSAATIGNVEHLAATTLQPGTYTMLVHAPSGERFGFAWQTTPLQEPADGGELIVRLEGQLPILQATGTFESAVVERSRDLENWTAVGSISPAEPTWADAAAPGGKVFFYRLALRQLPEPEPARP